MTKGKNLLEWFYLIAVYFVVPLYNEGTFDNITQRKVVAYQVICGLTLFFYFALSLIGDIRKKDTVVTEKRTLSPQDKLMILFAAAVVLSTVLSPYGKDAVYGTPGFGMGCLTILLMVLSYFLISRNLVCTDSILYLMTISSIIPTALVIINRLGYDPLHMYQEGDFLQGHVYVSTFGNYGWYNHYMTVIIPITLYMIFAGKKLWIKALYVAHLMLCVKAWTMAGTNSLLVSAAVVVGLMILAGFAGRIRLKIPLKLFIPVYMIIIGGYGYFIARATENDEFANARGFIWRLSTALFKSFNIKEKLFGIGPNCYTYSVDNYLWSKQDFYEQFNERFNAMALTSAHSEYFDYLIGIGIVGAVIYLILLGAFLWSFISGDKKTDVQRAAALCAVSYAVCTLFTFSIICATPMFFILLGISQSRENRQETTS